MRLIPATVTVIVLGLGGCGGDAHKRSVIRVGGHSITAATLAHWMQELSPEHAAPDPPNYTACVARRRALSPESVGVALKGECREQYRALKQQAVDLAISSQWLIGEAAGQGLKISADDVRKRLNERRRSLLPKAAGAPDLELVVKAELAELMLRGALIEHEPRISEAQIAKQYRVDIHRFERPERRYIDIVEKLDSEVAARRVIREIGHGKSLSELALHESFERMSIADVIPNKRAIIKAIFAAKPHVLVGPMPLNHAYSVFEVTRVTPAARQPLARVHVSLERELADKQRARTLARFIKAWRSRWIARTDCRPGYVVQKCKQYRGAKRPEDPFALR
jgi:foldase protein PrsA